MEDRFEVLMAGTGGQGVLTAGRLLAEAAVGIHNHVTWTSSYRAARRGGGCECTVIFSKNEIASFILLKTDVVIIMASSEIEAFVERVKPGGLMIYEPTGLPSEIKRSGIELLPVSGIEIASKIGAVQAANLVFLGVYIGITGGVPGESIGEKLESQFEGKALKINKEAFKKGLEIGENRSLGLFA